ncbi:hypothetical protein HPP92_017277 [Vanilla planifolia]|uniref:Uncharacterized protein n=1 Tax=Vanilla planifolia TaxID=51239 RepID=A0A835ULT0_VANPL|nr:hypothetical protein HPP92_017827 [Vanilla planifolia]KAG0467949.1 hypothetical protein HPP92_017277 [Vanilla planifolia]
MDKILHSVVRKVPSDPLAEKSSTRGAVNDDVPNIPTLPQPWMNFFFTKMLNMATILPVPGSSMMHTT